MTPAKIIKLPHRVIRCEREFCGNHTLIFVVEGHDYEVLCPWCLSDRWSEAVNWAAAAVSRESGRKLSPRNAVIAMLVRRYRDTKIDFKIDDIPWAFQDARVAYASLREVAKVMPALPRCVLCGAAVRSRSPHEIPFGLRRVLLQIERGHYETSRGQLACSFECWSIMKRHRTWKKRREQLAERLAGHRDWLEERHRKAERARLRACREKLTLVRKYIATRNMEALKALQ